MLDELRRIGGKVWGPLSRWFVQWLWKWRWAIWSFRTWGLIKQGVTIHYYSKGEWRSFYGYAPLVAWRNGTMFAEWMWNKYKARWQSGIRGWGWYKPQRW